MKKKLGIFIDWFTPAFKAGGPIQSISNLVEQISDNYEISIVTSNTDLNNEVLEIPNNELNIWIKKHNFSIIYIERKNLNISFFKEILKNQGFHILYFNSFFSLYFFLIPLILSWKYPSVVKVLAPRGMLGIGALSIKRLKKLLFINIFRIFNFHKGIVWHATSLNEKKDIQKIFGDNPNIMVAPNLSSSNKLSFITKVKNKKSLNIFFLSRISEKKNLHFILDTLKNLVKYNNISFKIIGPVDNNTYWSSCNQVIQEISNSIDIEYIGSIPHDQIPINLKDCHVLFLPTLNENYGHVIVESWQNGCPVIISDQTPWQQLELKKLGFDIPLSNKENYIQAIKFFYNMNGKTFAEWSQACITKGKKLSENPNNVKLYSQLF